MSLRMLKLKVADPHAFEVAIPAHGPLSDLAESFAGLTHSALTHGNRVRLVHDSRFFDEMLELIKDARETVHLENYLWKSGQISSRVIAALAAKAHAGVEVRVSYDAMGAREFRSADFDPLRNSPAELVRFRRVPVLDLTRLNRRDHRKILVVDSRVAWIFGHGMSDDWSFELESSHEWHDAALRLEGPIVNQIQSVFLENWMEVTGRAVAGQKYFPEQPRAGDVMAHTASVSPLSSKSAVERLYDLAFQAARESITVQNPYFLLNHELLKHLRDAAARNVKVRIMVPAAKRNDFPIVQHAGHHFFRSMIDAGVELYEYQRRGIHQKTIVVDGEWLATGSANLDPRSMRLNDEILVSVFSRDVAAELIDRFEHDLRYAELISDEVWKKRSLPHRLMDFGAALLKRQL